MDMSDKERVKYHQKFLTVLTDISSLKYRGRWRDEEGGREGGYTDI